MKVSKRNVPLEPLVIERAYLQEYVVVCVIQGITVRKGV
jgi:hypothetical protein